ncbi:MAG: SLC13 family permease, partial [Desulfovibrionaceae bacterium]|nr:SLC13 family permease [Desulfovibrionaceae bacterium]
MPDPARSLARKRALGLAVSLAAYLVLAGMPSPEGLSLAGQKSLALMVSAIIVWVTDALPLAMSCVLFLFLQAVLGTVDLPSALHSFAIPPVFFCFAMFCIVVAFQNSGLTRRVVLWTSLKSRGEPRRLLFLLMMVTALLSSILADVPVVAMMYPVALFLLQQNSCPVGESPFGKAVMLGIALAALIGGVGTPAGSGTNILTISMLENAANVSVSFFQWAAIGMPMVLLLTPVAWWALVKVYPPEMASLAGMDSIGEDYSRLGSLTRKEKCFIAFLAVNLALWCTTDLHGLSLPTAAVLGCMLFALPGVDLIEWERDHTRIGWDILFLVGAANSLGMALWKNGTAEWIAQSCLGGMGAMPLVAVIALVSLFTILIHLIIPVNTPIVSVLLPPVVAVAVAMDINPAVLAVPLGFSISAAILLPLDAVSLVT